MAEPEIEKPKPTLDLFGGRRPFGMDSVYEGAKKTVKGVGKVLSYRGQENGEPLVDYAKQREELAQRAVEPSKKASYTKEDLKKEQDEIRKYSGDFSPNYYSPKVSEEAANALSKKIVDERNFFIPSTAGIDMQKQALAEQAKLVAKEKPLETLATSNLEAQEKYNKELTGLENESESQAIKQAEEQSQAVPKQVQELMAEYPDLKREELVDSYGFAKKLAISFLGGVAGRPDIFNELIDKKIDRYNKEFDYRLDKLLRGSEASAKAASQLISSKIQHDTLTHRILQGSLDLNKARYEKTISPLEQAKLLQERGVLEQNSQLVLENRSNAINSLQDLQRSIAESLFNNPNKVDLLNPATGQIEQVEAKTPEIHKEWTQGDLAKGIQPKATVYAIASQNIKDLFNILNSGTAGKLVNYRELVDKFNGLTKLYPLETAKMGPLFEHSSTENQIKILQQIQNAIEFEKRNSFREPRVPTTLLRDIQSKLKR